MSCSSCFEGPAWVHATNGRANHEIRDQPVRLYRYWFPTSATKALLTPRSSTPVTASMCAIRLAFLKSHPSTESRGVPSAGIRALNRYLCQDPGATGTVGWTVLYQTCSHQYHSWWRNDAAATKAQGEPAGVLCGEKRGLNAYSPFPRNQQSWSSPGSRLHHLES